MAELTFGEPLHDGAIPVSVPKGTENPDRTDTVVVGHIETMRLGIPTTAATVEIYHPSQELCDRLDLTYSMDWLPITLEPNSLMHLLQEFAQDREVQWFD